jgi:hypothetical protein
MYPFWSSNGEIILPDDLVSRKDVVGISIIRKDGLRSPSMRDLAVAQHCAKRWGADGKFPFLLLVLSVPCDQAGWVFGMDFACYGVTADPARYDTYGRQPLITISQQAAVSDRLKLDSRYPGIIMMGVLPTSQLSIDVMLCDN